MAEEQEDPSRMDSSPQLDEPRATASAVAPIFTDEDLRQAQHYETLGPAYFAARRMAESLMVGAEAEPFKEVAKRCVDEIETAVYEYCEDHLRSDMESNLQHHVTTMVERTVQALLSGEEWAMRQYPLSSKHFEAVEIRAAVAKHGGEPLLMARIADLEKRVEELSQALKWERESRSRW